MVNVNRHPVDQLADVRAEIKTLQERETELKEGLLLEDADLSGSEYYARIVPLTQHRLDRKLLEQRFGQRAVEECCKDVETVQIRLVHREEEG
ncbi:hypothetical protein [Bradyrhizobium elkanii]|uniref:hypothetical protein n=1 Tax=Bradyrhizobium elkanii TaxID=29448 RepID=UPI0003F68081|nr:hypothetical protein [Bradyrhizobium elkanii]